MDGFCSPGDLTQEMPEEKKRGPESHLTTLDEMYSVFLSHITDDMFLELTREDTEEMLDEILMNALPYFEFPRKNIFDINWEERHFNVQLSAEEELIICQYMVAVWVGYQLASIELVKQKYSSSDFSFTSQASHMSRLMQLREHYMAQGLHLQRIYCRRRVDKDGNLVSTMDMIMAGDKK